MQFDYLVYVFLLIGIIYGLYRGVKREISFMLVFSVAVFVPLYLYNSIETLVLRFVPLSSIYDKMHMITDIFRMSEGCFTFLICYFVPFILICIFLNGLLYLIFFRKSSFKRKPISKMQRFLGGVVGIIVGVELSIVMMMVLHGITPVEITGFISELLLKIPSLSDMLEKVKQVAIA